MNKHQKRIITIAGNLSIIAFSVVAMGVSTVAWFNDNRSVSSEGMGVKVVGPAYSIAWNILKYDDDQKAGQSYRDESAYFLPSFDRYIQERNVYSNAIIKANVTPPQGFDGTQQLYVDITCRGELFDGSDVLDVTSNICQFKTTVYSYNDATTNNEVILNKAIDGTTVDSQYQSCTEFFRNTDSGAQSFVTINNNTPMKDRDKKITLIPRFECGSATVRHFIVYIECSYKTDLVDYYLANNGDALSGGTIELSGDISEIKFRFGEKYTGTYTKVTSQSQLTKDSRYMIMYDDFNVGFDGSGTSKSDYDRNSNYIPVERNGNKIKNNETVNNSDWLWKPNGSIESRAGWRVGSDSNDSMDASETGLYNTNLIFNNQNSMTAEHVLGSSKKYLRFNASEGRTTFRYYNDRNAQQAIQFYKYGDTPTDNITFDHIQISGSYPTTFNIGDEFSHQGMRVNAYYSDGSFKDVTNQCAWTGYNMNSISNQTVTVSYTEDGVTRNQLYPITVTSQPTVYVNPATLVGLVNGIGRLNATTVSFNGPVTFSWTNNDNTVARLNEISGDSVTVTYLAAGFSTITCTATDGTNTSQFQVSVRVTGSQASNDAYVRVERTSDITSGQYLIVNEDVSGALDANLGEAIDTPQNYLSVSITGNIIPSTAQTDAVSFTYNAGNKTLTNKSGLKLGNDSNTNKIKLDTGNYSTNLGYDATGNHAVIIATQGSNKTYMRFNTGLAQKRFRFYTDQNYGSAIQLFKKVEGASIKELVRIELEDYKTEFFTRDNFSYGGLVFAVYSDGTQENITNQVSFSSVDMNTPGSKSITVTYNKSGVIRTASYSITVTNPELTSISISTTNAQTEYYSGDAFNSSDMVVTAHYANGSTLDVSSKANYSGYATIMNTPGVHTVTVTYTEGGVSASKTYQITIFNAQNGWRKVSKDNSLGVGDHILIVAKNYELTMSSILNQDFRVQESISKVANGLLNTNGESVSPLTLGKNNGNWTLFDPINDGYLSTNLSISKTLDNSCNWSISILGSGKATIKNVNKANTNTIEYDYRSSTFSLMNEGSGKEVVIYKYYGTYQAPIINVKNISFDESSINLTIGSTYQLNLRINPYTATNKNVQYESDEPQVASISSTGLVTANTVGTAYVRAVSEDGSFFAYCTVTVNSTNHSIVDNFIGSKNTFLLNLNMFKGGTKAC